jgi:hypothetical protein
MKLGTYIISGIIFLFAITGAAYIFAPDDYELLFFDTPIDLPIAVWVMIPAVLLFIVSILHIAFYGTKSFLKQKKLQKDLKELKDAIYWGIWKEPKKHLFSTEETKSFGGVLNHSEITLKELPKASISDEKIKRAIELIKKIESGEYIDFREKGLDGYLSKDNEWVVKNGINKLKKEPEFAKIVLQKKEAYSDKLIQKALDIAIESWNFDELSKYSDLIDKERFYKILDLVDQDKKENFSLDHLRKFIDYEKFECKDFLRVAKTIIKKFSPDANLAFVKEMAKNSSKAEVAYLYTLFEYEMRDNIKRFFEEHEDGDFKIFRVYEKLKTNNFNIKLDDIITNKTACNES